MGSCASLATGGSATKLSVTEDCRGLIGDAMPHAGAASLGRDAQQACMTLVSTATHLTYSHPGHLKV
jgi:hypothetical protein